MRRSLVTEVWGGGGGRKKITGNETIKTSLKKFIESNMKWVSDKANIHVSKDGRKRIDDYKGPEYQNAIVANALLMLLLNALITGNNEIVAFERRVMAFQQLGAVMGTEPYTNGSGSKDGGLSYLGKTMLSDAHAREYMTLFNETSKLIMERFLASARTLEECEAQCEKIAIDFHEKSKSPLEGSPIKAMYFIGLRPFVRALYVGMFCKDDRLINEFTGKPYVRPDASVYDSRTANMLLMTAATQIIFFVLNELENNNVSDAKNDHADSSMAPLLMKAFVHTIVHFYARQDATTGDRAIMEMYKKVVKISKTNKQLRDYVLRSSKELMVRKEDAITMFHNMELSKKRTSAAGSNYTFWIITLLTYVIIAVIVHLRSSNQDVYWMNGVVLLLLATAW
eukprot:gene17314-23623_t